MAKKAKGGPKKKTSKAKKAISDKLLASARGGVALKSSTIVTRGFKY
jgi:hypothetical protein